MVYISPKVLDKNANIAIIAPASPFDSNEIHQGLKIISKNGFNSVLGDNVFYVRTSGLYSASLEQRVEEFIWAIEDDRIDAIICAKGGFGSGELLPHLPYDKIAASRKPIIGFSDITALNNGILAKSGLINFNGQTASLRTDTDEDKEKDSQCMDDMLSLLQVDEFWGNKPFIRNEHLIRCISPGKASGYAIGGNLSTFCSLIGTPYLPETKGAILFIEDINEGGLDIAPMLLNLKLSGVLNSVSGIVVGIFANQKQKVQPFEPSVEEIIVNYLKDGPPCIYGLNFSHISLSAVIPIGTEVYIDTDKHQVLFDNPFKYSEEPHQEELSLE